LICISICNANTLDHAKLVDGINAANVSWKAKVAVRWENLSLSEIKAQLNSYSMPVNYSDPPPTLPPLDEELVAALPAVFNGLDAWPSGCVHPIRDQGNCGSCWAFSVSETLSDRGCIVTNMQENVVLSPEALVACDYMAWAGANGCAGGYLVPAWSYCEYTGEVTDDCFPYVSGNGAVPKCPTTCTNGARPYPYYAVKGSTVTLGNVANIQNSLNAYGPVSACFTVYQDFVNYVSGVYIHTYGSNLGGHCIKIVGYNTASNPPYWIVANSWGTSWADYGGYFYIRLGTNECGIEANSIVAQA